MMMSTKLLLLIFLFPLLVYGQISHEQIWKVQPDADGTSENGEISADKKYVAIGNSKGEVKVYDFASGNPVRVLDFNKAYNPAVSKDGEVESIYFSFDSKYVAAGGNGHGIKIWRVSDWKEVKYIPGGECDGIAFAPNNLWFAAPSGKKINIYRISDWEKIASIPHGCGVNSIDFSKDSQYMLSGACDKTIKITTTANWKVSKVITCPHSTKSVRLSPDETLIASAHGFARSTVVWTFPGGDKVGEYVHGPDLNHNYQEAVEWTPDSRYVMTGGNTTGYVGFLDRNNDWDMRYQIKAHDHRSEYVARVDNYILSTGEDGTAALFRLSLGSGNNAGPNVFISQPTDGTTFSAGSDITLTATASDNDGSISKVAFYYNGTKIDQDVTSPYSVTWSGVAAGSYTLTAKATDNSGEETTSSPITVTVTSSTPSVTNIALNKPVLDQSSQQAGNVATQLVDGSTADRWSADVGGFPQWVVLDLGESYNITGTEFLPYNSRAYKYKVEVSASPTTGYTLAVDRTSNTEGGAVLSNTVTSVSGRYVKLTVTGKHTTYSGNWVSVVEFRVFGTAANNGGRLATDTNTPPAARLLLPNPASQTVAVSLAGLAAGKAELAIYNAAGTLVSSRQIQVTSQSAAKQIELSGLLGGTYTVILKQGGKTIVSKLVVVKE